MRIAAIEASLSGPEFASLQRVVVDAGTPTGGAGEEARAAAIGVHDEGYVEGIFAAGAARDADQRGGWIDADTYVGPGTLEAACAGVVSAREAVTAILAGRARTTFSLCRPPGHHATRDQAMGFCFFNNVAVAAQVARAAGLDRVAIVDFDVHHGNGTQDIFYDRADVLYVSTHQSPLYPGTGAAGERGRGDGEGFTLNIPMGAGTGDEGILEAFDLAVIPALDRFAPDLLLVSAGFDAHAADPLAQMEVTTAGFGGLATRLLDAADRLCGGRSAWVLEGGYDTTALAESVSTTVRFALDGC
ncbi:MAG: histone deacetylase family protein [Candidatus Dormibacteria bacterium]